MENLRPDHTDMLKLEDRPTQRWEKENPIGQRPIIIVAFGKDARPKPPQSQTGSPTI